MIQKHKEIIDEATDSGFQESALALWHYRRTSNMMAIKGSDFLRRY